jgi:hypothetical protein
VIKADELRDPLSCLNKADAEEPIFVLRAKDPLFAQTVRLWVEMAIGMHEPDKRLEARALAEMGAKWREERQPKPAEENMSGITDYHRGVAGVAGGAGQIDHARKR